MLLSFIVRIVRDELLFDLRVDGFHAREEGVGRRCQIGSARERMRGRVELDRRSGRSRRGSSRARLGGSCNVLDRYGDGIAVDR